MKASEIEDEAQAFALAALLSHVTPDQIGAAISEIEEGIDDAVGRFARPIRLRATELLHEGLKRLTLD